MLNCPICGWRSIGRVSSENYYCWDCCVEFKVASDDTVAIYNIEVDGTLSQYSDEFVEVGVTQ